MEVITLLKSNGALKKRNGFNYANDCDSQRSDFSNQQFDCTERPLLTGAELLRYNVSRTVTAVRQPASGASAENTFRLVK